MWVHDVAFIIAHRFTGIWDVVVNAFVMIVDRNGQNLFRVILTNHVLIKKFKNLQEKIFINFIPN